MSRYVCDFSLGLFFFLFLVIEFISVLLSKYKIYLPCDFFYYLNDIEPLFYLSIAQVIFKLMNILK